MVRHIAVGNIRNETQFNTAMEFLMVKSKTMDEINEAEFVNYYYGSSVVISIEEMEELSEIDEEELLRLCSWYSEEEDEEYKENDDGLF